MLAVLLSAILLTDSQRRQAPEAVGEEIVGSQ